MSEYPQERKKKRYKGYKRGGHSRTLKFKRE